MKIDTKYFGEIEYTEDETLTFPKGLFGFEDERAFLLLPFSEQRTMYSLQSLKTPELAFIVVDPFAICPPYAPVLQGDELQTLGVEKSEELYFYSMCAAKEPVGESTVNLKCPIAINGDTLQAMQVILEDGRYQMHHKLSEFAPGEEPSC